MSFVGRALRPLNAVMSSYELAQRLGGGQRTIAGVVITPETALRISAVFACVRIVAEDIGKLPFILYKDLANGDRERATSSPYWRLVHDRFMGGPNTFTVTSQQGREYLTSCALLRGDGFAWKVAVGGQTYELVPINPNRVRMEEVGDGEVVYHVRMKSGVEETFTREKIFHLAGPMIDSWYKGASVVQLGAQGFGLAGAAANASGRLLGNDMMPRGILTTDGKMDPDAAKRMKQDWKETNGGDNAGGVAVFQQGLKFQAIGMSPADIQLLDTYKFTVNDIAARWFRIPLHKVGSLGGMTWHSIESESLDYVTDTLMGWGVRWDNAFNTQVIVGNQIHAELLFDGLLRGDPSSRFMSYQSAILTGWMTRNEARRRENLNHIDGLDEAFVPTNEQTVAALAAGTAAAGGSKNGG